MYPLIMTNSKATKSCKAPRNLARKFAALDECLEAALSQGWLTENTANQWIDEAFETGLISQADVAGYERIIGQS